MASDLVRNALESLVLIVFINVTSPAAMETRQMWGSGSGCSLVPVSRWAGSVSQWQSESPLSNCPMTTSQVSPIKSISEYLCFGEQGRVPKVRAASTHVTSQHFLWGMLVIRMTSCLSVRGGIWSHRITVSLFFMNNFNNFNTFNPVMFRAICCAICLS